MKTNKIFSIKEIRPRIFLLSFKSYFKMGMYFLRYQEFYESSSSKFRDKSFTILDFMEWYVSKHRKYSFTYTKDFEGYNIPGNIIKKVHDLGIPDPNKYDKIMYDVYEHCLQINGNDNFYIIGAVGKGETLRHEISHGLFFTNKEYRSKMRDLVSKLDYNFIKTIYKDLRKIGYTTKVLVDETQAYLATGLTSDFTVDLNGEDQAFIKTFNKFYKK